MTSHYRGMNCDSGMFVIIEYAVLTLHDVLDVTWEGCYENYQLAFIKAYPKKNEI